MHNRMRMIAAGTAVALLTGTAGAAAATTSGSTSAPTSSAAPYPLDTPSFAPFAKAQQGESYQPFRKVPVGKQPRLVKIAAILHVSVMSLDKALVDAKSTMARQKVGPTDPAVVSVVAHDLGVDTKTAGLALRLAFSSAAAPGEKYPSPGAPDPVIAHALADVLHISDAQAMHVLVQLWHIDRSKPGDVVTDSPQFRTIAASLHLTPQQLADALRQMKQILATQAGSSSKAPGA